MNSEDKALLAGGALLLAVIAAVVIGLLVGLPLYKVWKKEQDGKAALSEAQHSKLVQIEEAKANLEAEKLNAQAEIERAKGAAKAIQIEGGELTENYIRYLWVRNTADDEKQTIYIPTEGGLPILESNPAYRSP